MNKEENKIVPQLRFPEFRDEWEVNILGNKKISFFPNIKIPKDELEIDTYVGTENLLPDYGGVKKSKKLPDSGSFTTYQTGDVLVANIRPYLKKVWFADRKGAASNDVFVFRKGSSISENYLQHILKNDIFINYVMKGAKGVKMPRGDKSLIKKYTVYFPSNPKEQQKIANCLSSLDNVINAETKKLNLLQDHKKGLLQQLFPAEGETKPKFRFPEFMDDGNWEETALENCLDYLQPTPYLVSSTEYDDKFETPVLTAGKTFILGYTDEKEGIFNENLPVIIFDDFTTASKFVDFAFKGKSSAMKILLAKDDNNVKFIFEVIQNLKFEVSTHKRHWISVYSKLNILRPKDPKEQEKIADCFSAIDELIKEQEHKIEKLQDHKKGLLQQMFPNLNELAI